MTNPNHHPEDRMNTDTSSPVDQSTTAEATPKPPRDKVMRIASLTKQLLDEIHTQTLDTASLERLRTVDTHIIDELLSDLAPDLGEELHRLALPLTGCAELAEAELRLAHAQLVGWLQGLLTQSRLPDGSAPNEDSPAIRSARHTLITAITRCIEHKRLTEVQAAAVLRLTGRRVTQLVQANIEEFALDELVNLLPALDLILQVVPAPQHDEKSSA
jgi:predicted XRE-type DNA-binding protein